MSPANLEFIRAQFAEWAGETRKGWLSGIDPAAALQYVVDTDLGRTTSSLAVIENALVMWTVGSQWWSSRPILGEEIIMSLDHQYVDMARITAFLETYARACGCAGVAIGTSLALRDESYARLLGRYGYRTEAHLLYKEIT